MSWVNTGVERCQTFRIDKLIQAVSISGYPKDYNLLAAFTAGGNSYGALSLEDFRKLSEIDYMYRLNDFKTYIEEAEGIASIDATTEAGYEAYRTNIMACPVGEE